MADEAFALSPISARATQPSEADYDAIREAFMETSRGRWFLGEYAKRNRNADTRLVLDAVARIEETLAAQKKPSRDPLLDQALAGFRSALDDARQATQAALHNLALEEQLAPVRKGTRVIREIAWRLREIGADGRICDLIDSQVSAIEGATAKIAPGDLASALGGAFDLIEARIAAFDAGEEEIAAPLPAEAARSDASDGTAPTAAAEAVTESPSVAASPSERLAAARAAASAARQPEATISREVTAVEHMGTGEPEAQSPDAFTPEDEAVLERIALEMAAPDSDAAYEPPMEEMAARAMEEAPRAAEPPAPRAPEAVVQTPVAETKAEIPADDIEIIFVSEAAETPAEPVLHPPTATALVEDTQHETAEAELASLGSSLIANGIVQRPRNAKPDPLAPIRRMSQSERIAFFS